MNLIDELRWRGMIHDITPGAEEKLAKEKIAGYIGVDPTSDSLHVGNLASLMLLVHFQRYGHQPFALVGGATGMVGDPSGKSEERNLLSEEVLNHNVAAIQKQLENLLCHTEGDNPVTIVNNYDWFKDMHVLDFLRDVGKHLTVSYMMAKDSVKSRLEKGISFTEFSYQLIQGYDFYHLHKEHNCQIQFGGSDQWGNIVAGTELIRRIGGGEGFAFTCPLITKADGTKFGKTAGGSVWLDANKTSPYQFYQFWINASDEDAKKYIRVFTLLDQETILDLEKQHDEAPHQRLLQKTLAKEVTILVHDEAAYEKAVSTSQLLFGKGSKEALAALSDQEILEIFEGVPTFKLDKKGHGDSLDVVDFLSDHTGILKSKGEARRSLKENSISINMEKVKLDGTITANDLLNDRFILVQKGKKNKFLVIAE